MFTNILVEQTSCHWQLFFRIIVKRCPICFLTFSSDSHLSVSEVTVRMLYRVNLIPLSTLTLVMGFNLLSSDNLNVDIAHAFSLTPQFIML